VTDQGDGLGPDDATPDAAAAGSPATCPWCGAAAAPDATRCIACGAALAQRESIGDLRIPGLTSVDPALEDFDKRPLHLRGPSPSQGVAPALIVGAVAGGPIGLVAIGGVAAVAGAEFLGARIGGPSGTALEDVGKPSEVALQALSQLDDAAPGATGAASAADAGTASAPSMEPSPEPDPAAADNGRSIWRDLPPGSEPDGS
jgi:hypothetical protein